jgi:hypothetical protein
MASGFSLWDQPAVTMSIMRQRSFFRLSFLVAAFFLLAASLITFAQDSNSGRGRKYKSPPPTGRIEVTILRDADGKPIENASVIFHPLENGKDAGNMELKSNEDGKTVIDVLPLRGAVRMQVIAHGFQTWGQDYQIDKDDYKIEIRMKRPGEQYSIYKKPDESTNAGKPAPGPNAAAPVPTPSDQTQSAPAAPSPAK